jgi:hypothetical protein
MNLAKVEVDVLKVEVGRKVKGKHNLRKQIESEPVNFSGLLWKVYKESTCDSGKLKFPWEFLEPVNTCPLHAVPLTKNWVYWVRCSSCLWYIEQATTSACGLLSRL